LRQAIGLQQSPPGMLLTTLALFLTYFVMEPVFTAAWAAGMVPLELGSDAGGSIRVPASFCGVFGHLSSFDIISLEGFGPPGGGMIAQGRNWAAAGPMARRAEDL
ncbi:MAG TPA: amidase family protein, partial [Caulobacter sp.]|nr:amidase family protein [Caulobacter sp.]